MNNRQLQPAILIVDDEEDVLAVLHRDLAEWAEQRGVRIYTVGSGQEALRILHDEYPDVVLVLSDLRMPGMNGADLLVRLYEEYPDVGTILITAYSDMDQITRAVSSSMLGLIQKPWKPVKLRQEVTRAYTYVQERRDRDQRNRELTAQLEMAGAFQRAAMGTTLPDDPRSTFEVLSRPMHGMHVTGDFSEILRVDPDRYLLLVGDAAGHGIRAALLSGMLTMILREYAGVENGNLGDPTKVLERLNRGMHEHLPPDSGMIAACSVAVVDLARQQAQIANAGNPAVFIVGGEDHAVSAVLSPALGISPETWYDTETVPIEANHRVVLFSDGLFTRSDSSGTQMSRHKIGTILQGAHRSASFGDSVLRLITADRILQGYPTVPLFSDDLTIVSMAVR
ncbi:MAG: PP2C family protein-serine/threonine phosphatase [Alkalispirochaeta sp.]